MSLDGLNDYSREFARLLFAEWPAWEAHATVTRDEATGEGYLVVKVPDPAGSRLAHPLTVWTDNGEVTIGMDWDHSHFVWPTDREDLASDITDPIGALHLLINEERAVLAQFAGDTWKGSCLLSREDCVAGRYRERPSEDWLSPVDRFRVRSWRGTLDADGGY